jgi:DNA polymerase-4
VLVGSGVVLAASYEAKARGVRTPMNCRQALLLCPDAVVVDPRMCAYSEASRAVFEVFEDTTPLVEGLSVDEAFLEVGGLRRIAGTPEQIGRKLRRDVAARVGLPITVGVARTKFLAKVASAVAKPDGLLVVPPDDELAFLHPLPVERLWGVGPVTAQRLHAQGIRTVGEVASKSPDTLVRWLGKASGSHLHALAHNLDPRPVVTGRRRKSVGAQRALGRGRRSPAELDATLVELVDRVTRRMRSSGRSGRTVVLRIRFGDFTSATRSRTVERPTANTTTILGVARDLLHEAQPMLDARGLTLVGVAVGNLDDETDQPGLPFDRTGGGALDDVLDGVRTRFGQDAITRAVQLGREQGVAVPVLPD